jgi:anti-sigma regulatory factor (Ser/Thr protein kinase)
MALGRSPEAAALARRAIGELRADLDPPLMETLRLLVTELVTNSVRHTAADFVTLKVAVGKSAVITEVADSGPGFAPECVEQAGADDTGWGLFLVQRLANAWGVKHDGPSKRVWFELRRA